MYVENCPFQMHNDTIYNPMLKYYKAYERPLYYTITISRDYPKQYLGLLLMYEPCGPLIVDFVLPDSPLHKVSAEMPFDRIDTLSDPFYVNHDILTKTSQTLESTEILGGDQIVQVNQKAISINSPDIVLRELQEAPKVELVLLRTIPNDTQSLN